MAASFPRTDLVVFRMFFAFCSYIVDVELLMLNVFSSCPGLLILPTTKDLKKGEAISLFWSHYIDTLLLIVAYWREL
jgi:hypothetical protein